jgi:transcriptional regulator with XRE-family HTH domain
VYDYDEISRELLRAVRGRRSQRVFSKRLGYRTNVASRWESGARYPIASRLFGSAIELGVPVRARLDAFDSRIASIRARPDSPRFVHELLALLAGDRSRAEIARAAEMNRLAVSRFLRGVTEPRVPALLAMIEALTGRLDSFIGVFVDPLALPTLHRRWQEHDAWRKAAYEIPLSEAIVAHLESDAYVALPAHVPGWIASRAGIPIAVEREAIEWLARARVIERRRGKWVARPNRDVDTRGDRAAFDKLARFWLAESSRRIGREPHGLCGYIVFSASEAALAGVVEIYRRAYIEARTILTESEGSERVALLTTAFVPLDGRVIPR